MDRVDAIAKELLEKYEGVDRKEIIEKLKKLLIEFKVPENEARRTMENYIMREYGIPRESVRETFTRIGDITEAGKWVNVKAKVIQIWESSSPSIAQTGLIGDESGVIRFLMWTKANKPPLVEGKSYIFRNVVVDDFGNVLRLNINRTSEIVEVNEDIEVKPLENLREDIEVVGALVAIQQNSGLIQRCSVEGCNRVVKSGKCPIHGKVRPVEDLRIKGVIDDGERTYEVIINEDGVKELTGIDIEKAIKMAEEHFDRGVVLAELKTLLLGKYLKVTGSLTPRYLIARKVEFYRPQIRDEVDKLLAELEG